MYPQEMSIHEPIDLKLGIKSSFPKVKSALALTYLLWKASDKPSRLLYTEEITLESGKKNVQLNSNIVERLEELFTSVGQTFDINEINENKLFSAQIESIIVAFELVWKIAKVVFDEERSFSSERQGGNRYNKVLCFSRNIDILDLLIDKDDVFLKILINWALKKDVDQADFEKEVDLIKMFTYLSEEAIYRLRTEDENDIKFMNVGIYQQLSNQDEAVSLKDRIESIGAIRILKEALLDNLNHFIYANRDGVHKKEGVNSELLRAYSERVSTYLELTDVKIVISENHTAQEDTTEESTTSIDLPYNRIVYGAPGTGKSYKLEEDRKDQTFASFERVTFYPNYSYSQFVGTYKPVPIDDEKISYKYVPGPFVRILIKALNNPSQNYLLLIEEINRANVSSVFGDIFQLLDRSSDGSSQYTIAISNDLKEHLNEELRDEIKDSVSELYIPKNLYIWSTMNSADQGVFSLDSAFKRRWSFEYTSVNNGVTEMKNPIVEIYSGKRIHWNDLRMAINKNLSTKEISINEDKLIGPFFLKENELNEEAFDKSFKNKLLMYLYEDVLKHKKGMFFTSEATSFSKLIDLLDAEEEIFNFDLDYIDESTEAE
jgi:hypothetical protein